MSTLRRRSGVDDDSDTRVSNGNADKKWQWGRSQTGTWMDSLGALVMITCPPFLVIFLIRSCHHEQCSLFDTSYKLLTTGFDNHWISWPTPTTWLIYIVWFLIHLVLYAFVPTQIGYGQPTPAGHVLPYRVNGWRIWWITHIGVIAAAYLYISTNGKYGLNPRLLQLEWEHLVVVLNVIGYFWTFFAYFKAYHFPSHADDRKFSGSTLYDLFMGIEANPRLGEYLDFKLFFNGRPGIGGWTIINLSFTYAQYARYGYVTNSMFLVNLFHGIYVLDFFYHEDWYLRTIDIAHDHFGFYLAWGDTIWLPMLYTLQGLYLYFNPVELSWPYFGFVVVVGLYGYYIFRTVNNQKDLVRATDGKCEIWGKPAEFIRCKYLVKGGTKSSILLTSGYWGLSRHFNYVGDLLISAAMCLACGFNHIYPYFYVIYMTIVLVHRVGRDNSRCKAKYGKYWDEYCEKVPYKILPYVY